MRPKVCPSTGCTHLARTPVFLSDLIHFNEPFLANRGKQSGIKLKEEHLRKGRIGCKETELSYADKGSEMSISGI